MSLIIVKFRGEDLYVRIKRVQPGEEVTEWEFVRPEVEMTEQERAEIGEQVRTLYQR